MKGHYYTKRFVFCFLGVMSISDIQITDVSIFLVYLCVYDSISDSEGDQRRGQVANVL